MDWKMLFSAFGLLLLAELGDKTQLAVVFLSASSKKPMAVFTGASLALVLVTFVGATLGNLAAHHLPTTLIHRLSGAVFIILGILLLLR